MDGHCTMSLDTISILCLLRISRVLILLSFLEGWTVSSLRQPSHHVGYCRPRLEFRSRTTPTSFVLRRALNRPPQPSWVCFALYSKTPEGSIGLTATPSEKDIEALPGRITKMTQRRQYETAYKLLCQIVHRVKDQQCNGVSEGACRAIDEAFRIFTQTVFAPHDEASIQLVLLGIDAINLQLSLSGRFVERYDNVPRNTFVKALQALTRWNEKTRGRSAGSVYGIIGNSPSPSILSYRILQRLITGVGIRTSTDRGTLYEKDINQVLNTFANSGRMDICTRIVALQQRSNRAPPLSPASYSILIKGYGKLGDLANVEAVLKESRENTNLQPDTVFMNSLLDAFINCNAINRAREAFLQMKSGSSTDVASCKWFREMPRPNKTTYNIMLKGLARSQNLIEALELSKVMRSLGMWDAISLNTLVTAALSLNDFDLAQNLLDQYTSLGSLSNYEGKQHPNTEAYTNLLDHYAKVGRLSDSLRVFQMMRQRSVTPNEITYACLISGLARNGKADEARMMLRSMNTTVSPTSITYNAFISALLTPAQHTTTEATGTSVFHETKVCDDHVDEAMKLLKPMIQSGVVPNSITVSTIVDALGRCSEPRVADALMLVDKLREQELISFCDLRVMTALVRTCGVGGDISNAISAFRNMSKPDLIAVNVFLDACCRCDRGTLAMGTFRHYFGEHTKSTKDNRMEPDVISYSILISYLLENGKPKARDAARNLYVGMKSRMIRPDMGLVDSILKKMLSLARRGQLSRDELGFVTTVVRDAEQLDWPDGHLERRKRAVRAVLSNHLKWLQESDRYGKEVLEPDPEDDDLFRRKGWNQINSGFRFWG